MMRHRCTRNGMVGTRSIVFGVVMEISSIALKSTSLLTLLLII